LQSLLLRHTFDKRELDQIEADNPDYLLLNNHGLKAVGFDCG